MKRIAVTVGDPGGIGPEVALKALAEVGEGLGKAVIVGPRGVVEAAHRLVRPPFKLADTNMNSKRIPRTRGRGSASAYKEKDLPRIEDSPSPGTGSVKYKVRGKTAASGNWTIEVLDTVIGKRYTRGRPTEEGGRAAAEAIKMAVKLALDGSVHAVVTGPISKEALRMAGYTWPGHTEMLAELTGTRDFGMMLVGGPLRVMLTTIHEAIREVPALITFETVLGAIRLAQRACRMLSLKRPRIAVAGLNPHAGEGGMFGSEEMEIIAPAVREARKEGMDVSGPWPPDTVFYRAGRGEFDIVVCMYHDQGLIPLKLVAFETGVNVTVGLPFIRTSPDHGTAYEIAWKNEANPSSMAEAIRLAASLKIK
jgi:4-hydroxythreonine-4-phosphate dehydrogenase